MLKYYIVVVSISTDNISQFYQQSFFVYKKKFSIAVRKESLHVCSKCLLIFNSSLLLSKLQNMQNSIILHCTGYNYQNTCT